VVGVARDVKSSSLVDGLADSFVYLPLQQHYTSNVTSTMTIAVRTTHGEQIADEIRTAVASMDPTLAIVTSQTLEDSTALGLVPQRVAASLSGSLGIVGLLLAGIGIYGVTAYTVARRTREIGIRIAVGAQRRDIVGMVLGQGMAIAGIGSAVGSILGAAASQLLTGFLFGIRPLDPILFAGAVVLPLAIGLAACYVPARRATKVDPLVALRYE
jgi:ABC-type antimicrobial peptide transport system permease subunit